MTSTPVTSEVAPRAAAPGMRADGQSSRWLWLAFAAACVASAAVILYEGRGLIFFFDELTWIVERRDPSVDSLLRAHAGHISVIPVALYQLWFRIFGIDDYAPYRVLVLMLHLVCATVVFVYLRHRLSAIAAMVPTVVILFFGAGWQDILWPFQIGFLLSVAGGVGAFLLLGGHHPRRDVGVVVCVSVALASSSIGVPVAAGIALELALRREWRRLWTVGVPGVLYLVWYAVYSETLTSVDDPVAFVRFVVKAAGAVVGALVGLGNTGGQVLLLALVPFVVVSIVRAESSRRARLLALAAVPVIFWCSIAFTRAGFQPPDASRYLYPAAVFVVLLLAECLRGVHLQVPVLVAIVLVGAWSVVWNVGEFEEGRDVLLRITHETEIELGAIDIGVRGVDPEYAASRPPVPDNVRIHVEAFEEFGSPAPGPAEIRRRTPDERKAADAFMVHALALRLGPGTAPTGPAPLVTRGEAGAADGSCVVFAARAGGAVDVEVDPRTTTLLIEADGAPVAVRLRNFGDTYFTEPDDFATVDAGSVRSLPVPDVTAGSWHVGLKTAGTARVCGAATPD